MTIAYESDWCHGNAISFDELDEPKIEMTLDEAKYALKCIRYLASGFDFDLSEKDIQTMWDFADKIYRRVESVKRN